VWSSLRVALVNDLADMIWDFKNEEKFNLRAAINQILEKHKVCFGVL